MSFIQPPSQQRVVVTEGRAPIERIRPQPDQQQVTLVPFGTPNVLTIFPNVGFEVRIYDILNPNGAPLTVVPNPQTVTFEDTLSDVGSGTVTLATEDVLSSYFTKDNVWKIYWLGIEVFSFLGTQIQDTQVQASEEHDRTIAGNGIGQALDWMKTYPGNFPQASGGPAPTAVQTFTNKSRAAIYETMLDQGQARGTLTWMDQYLWTDNVDTHNVAWSDVNTLTVDAGTSMLTLLQDYATATPFDWHVDTKGRISLWKTAGTNRTVTIKVAPVGTVISSVITTDFTNLWDVVLVEDQNQGFTEQTDATSISAYSRREQFNSSTTVLDATGRADLGFSLLQQWKNPAVQKLVQVDTGQVGRRPYIDYFLGDTITVEFTDGTTAPARVIAIAMNGGDGVAEEAQLTLDFMLSQASLQNAGTTNTAITGAGGGGFQVVYADNTGNPFTVGTITTLYITISVEAFTDTFAEVFTSLEGTLSANATVTATVLVDSNVTRTLQHTMLAGPVTWTPVFMVPALPAAVHSFQLELSVSAGTLSIPSGDLQFWVEGPDINGGIGGGNPEMNIIDVIPFAFNVPTQHVSTAYAASTQTPLSAHPTNDIIHAYQTVTDSDGSTMMLQLGYVISVGASGDDGATSSIPSFTSTATQLEVGNDGGLIWGSYMHFIIPATGIPSGVTITHAFLTIVGDQNDSGVVAVIHAEHAASPTDPTSRTDFLGRTRTTASVGWSTSVTSGGTLISPDFTNVIQELSSAFPGAMTTINIFVEDNGSPLNGKMLWRSVNNAANQPPVLTIRWHP